MTTYNVKYTDINTAPITIGEGTVDNSLDISLFGRIRQEYGEELNENLLAILENFSCPEDESVGSDRDRLLSPTPDLSIAVSPRLQNPIIGQFWYNSTRARFYRWNGSEWAPFSNRSDISANWGKLSHGNSLPLPVSDLTGYTFTYEECIWSVAPSGYAVSFQEMHCYTDSNGVLTMQYLIDDGDGGTTWISGTANYLIIGIRGNIDNGIRFDPDNLPVPTPTMDVTPTPTPTPIVE